LPKLFILPIEKAAPCQRGFLTDIDGQPLFTWHDDPKQEVDQQARYAARNKRDDHCQTEPEGADPKEFTESATNTGQHPISTRTVQALFLMCSHFMLLSLIIFNTIYAGFLEK
jgi:hypothetical protein